MYACGNHIYACSNKITLQKTLSRGLPSNSHPKYQKEGTKQVFQQTHVHL